MIQRGTVWRSVALGLTLVATVLPCRSDEAIDRLEAPATDRVGTVPAPTMDVFSQPVEGLDHDQLRRFAFGNRVFGTHWILPPASATAFDGLGPLFNGTACVSCHLHNGRGVAPESPDTRLRAMVLRVSSPGESESGGPIPHPRLGLQVQELADPNRESEGRVVVRWTERIECYGDGTEVSLRRPSVELLDPAGKPVTEPMLAGLRIAPPVIGAGLLDAVSSEFLRGIADPEDLDEDGISGKLNLVRSLGDNRLEIGRFGWKAETGSLEDQVASALASDIGITSPLVPGETPERPDGDRTGVTQHLEPEIDPAAFEKLVFYNRTLAIPQRRHPTAEPVLAGERIFKEIGCEACHRSDLPLADFEPIPSWAGQKIRPYTDLLLHDMGEALSDGRPVFEASAQEWRTPPLWGIGLVEQVNGVTHFLHDGRARNLEEAILWHGGEAEISRDKFADLELADRERLIAFLQDL